MAVFDAGSDPCGDCIDNKDYWTGLPYSGYQYYGFGGNGYYGIVFQVYNLALMLTSYSLPMAVSKLVSARISTGQYRNAYRVYKGAMTFAVLTGGFVTAVVFFGARFIAADIMKVEMSVYALRVLAPCILIVAFLGVFRGFFRASAR